MSRKRTHLDGHPCPGDPLSPRTALKQLSPVIRLLTDYDPLSLWEQDTRSLPWPLGSYRRRVRDFARRELLPRALRCDLDPHGPEVRQVLLAAAREGYLTDLLPWPLGDASPPLFAHAIPLVHALKVEELCAACAGLGVMLGVHGLGAIPLILSGSPGTIRRFLLPAFRRTRAGEPHLFAFAITEPGAGSDVEESTGAATYRPQTTAERVSGGWRLDGRKVFISGGDVAESVTVFAAIKGEGIASWTCFLVERGMPGFSVVRTERKMGQRANAAAELLFEEVFVPDDHVVGELRGGWALNRATLNFSRLPVGAIALGIARGALEAATCFACRATLASKPLVHYQEVQLALASMMARTSAMRALVWQSARPMTPTQGKAALTKLYCSDEAMRVCEAAMELMGNHGLLHENRAEKALRDARLTQIYEGTNQINRLALIEDLQEQLLRQVAAPDLRAREEESRMDTFFQVPRTRHATSAGEVELPILYYDTSALLAYLLGDREAVAARLRGTGLRPALTFGSKAVVGLALYEYRDSSIGSYNEVGLALSVLREADPWQPLELVELLRDPRRRRLGFHILHLPVTTEAAFAAGKELWGYPKFVTELPLRFGHRSFEGSVLDPDDGRPILELAGHHPPGPCLPGLDLLLYSRADGRALRTVVDVRGCFTTTTAGTLRLRIGPSAHPMADDLRGLGLDGARPLLVQRCDAMQSLLHAGEPL